MLHMELDKSEQTSDWERRPLTSSQVAYASVDAAILPPLYAQLTRSLRNAPQPPSLTQPPPQPPSSNTAGAIEALEDASTTPSQGGTLPHPLMSRDLPLPIGALLGEWLGKEVGTRANVVRLCANGGCTADGCAADGGAAFAMVEPKWRAAEAPPPGVTPVVQCGDGGAVTVWRDGACLYVNAGRYRNGPSARYRNRFFRGDDGASVMMSWFPGRAHTVQSPAVARLLSFGSSSGGSLLLFCRRSPTAAYYCFGRLEPVAVALPAEGTSFDSDAGSHAGGGDGEAGWPCWRIVADGHVPSQDSNLPAPHVLFRLCDAAALQPPIADALQTVLGGREVEAALPGHYQIGLRSGRL